MRLALAREGSGTAGVVAIDRKRTMPGRGAYLCKASTGDPRSDCLRQATRSGRLARTLRSRLPISAELVESLSDA